MTLRKLAVSTGDIIMLASLALAAVGLPFFFAYSTVIASALGKSLAFQVEPSISGGRLITEFADPLDDDRGAGELEYPLGQAWERGELDLVRYAVREPVRRPVWGETGAYWQLEATFAKAVACGIPGGGFRAPVLHVYIAIDGVLSGSTESAYGEGELVRFDPGHPWNYAVSADGWSGRAEIRSADGKYRAPVEQSWDVARRRLTLRIGLAGAPLSLASVLSGRRTWQYVLVGAYDNARDGHFAAMRENANLHDGGGAKDELCPRVFDLIAPSGSSQESELSSENAAKGELALLHPVEVGEDLGAAAMQNRTSVEREALEVEAASDEARAKAERAREVALLPPPSAADSRMIGKLFSLGLEDRALVAANAALLRRQNDPVALAYRGAIVAKFAGRAGSLGEKMRLVVKAYTDLDAAVAASKNQGATSAADRIAVLFCRGNVSSAVPNDVFGRAAQGADDFEAARDLASSEGDSATARLCFADAAIAFEKAGQRDEAATRWAALARMAGLPAALRLELLEKGYPTVK
jgi:hypothetical protein